MPDAPKIPFGFRLVQGQSQKGDGIWDGTRFRKVRKGYPFAGDSGLIIIRRCEQTQTVIAVTELARENNAVASAGFAAGVRADLIELSGVKTVETGEEEW